MADARSEPRPASNQRAEKMKWNRFIAKSYNYQTPSVSKPDEVQS